MSAAEPFSLTPDQQERLLTWRAAWEEGEDEERLERLRQREEDAETLRAFAQQLAEIDFARGGVLSLAQMARLLSRARALAPNPNLDARLLRRPGEPETLNQDLRDLLYGAATAPFRLRQFLSRRHAGGQTALQLLCAAYPTKWPLVTRAGLKAIDLAPAQWRAARDAARLRFDLPLEAHRTEAHRTEVRGTEARTLSEVQEGVPDRDPILHLLAETLVYEAARDLLAGADFVATHRLLTQGRSSRPATASRRSHPIYPPLTVTAARVRESGSSGYAAENAAITGSPAAPPDLSGLLQRDLLAGIERYVAAQGFTYPPLALRDYYISLQSRSRFVILSGVSGTGKTRLTSFFAAALSGNASAQYRLLPVRPDWADSAPLLGYINLLAGGGEGRFVTTPFLDFLSRASRPENAFRAYFICLDEMNLARVEHYLAELLSAMETQERELLLPDGQTLRLPDNLFFIGTLNIDEGTHTLSRKVLDRANTLVFNEVFLQEPETPVETEAFDAGHWTAERRQALFLQARVATPAAARARLRQLGGAGEDPAKHVVDTLVVVNALLEPHDLQFAYRVRDEALIYCANSFDLDGGGLLAPDDPGDVQANLRVALDLQLLQRVLPRLTGSQDQIEAPIRDLLNWAKRSGFPRATLRLSRLLARLQREGFVGLD